MLQWYVFPREMLEMCAPEHISHIWQQKWYQVVWTDSRVQADARIQPRGNWKVASYFEMYVRGCYIVEVYYHVDEQEDGSKK